MLKSSFKILVLILFIHKSIGSNTIDDNHEFKIEIEKEKGKFVKIELKEFVNKGIEEMSTLYSECKVQKKAIMVLGLSGTGKSTLVNYLNGVPLVCKKTKKWVIDLEDMNNTLPCGFQIGHAAKSQTQYPAAYTPPGKEYAFIDNPGFQDSRGIAIEISNGFFREQVTRQTDELKFLLLISHQDLNLRGQQFRDSIRAFSDFLGIFDDNDTKSLSRSIGIIVTRVEQDDETDEEMIEIFKMQLDEILIDMKKSLSFKNKNEELIFKQVIENNQIGIFSNPRKAMKLDDRQSKKMYELINSLSYINTNDAKVRVRIQQNFIPKLLVYTEKLYNAFQEEFESEMKKVLLDYYKQEKNEVKNIQNASLLLKSLNRVFTCGSEKSEYETFLSKLSNDRIVDNEKKLKFLQLKDLLSFLVQILPEENRKGFSFNKKWLSEKLSEELNGQISDLIQIAQDEFNELVKAFEKAAIKSSESYFIKFMDYKTDLEKTRQTLINFRDRAVQVSDFDSLLDKDLFEKKTRNSLVSKQEDLNEFIVALNDEKKREFSFKRVWISNDVSNKITTIVDFLNKYSIEKSKTFEEFIEKILTKRISEFFAREIDAASYLSDLNELEAILADFEVKANRDIAFNIFLNDINSNIMINSENKQYAYIDKLLNKNKPLKWFGTHIKSQMDKLNEELQKYYEEKGLVFDPKQGILSHHGYFSNMSLISAQIKRFKIKDQQLTAVRIYATHSFDFDADYSIDRLKYNQNAPDLVIIAPIVRISAPVSVDLSCFANPDYPGGLSKAKNGIKESENGADGKPGLPGYNGGNLFIFADNIQNLNYLNFASNGGQGGKGQDGGDGAEGLKGKASEIDNVIFNQSNVVQIRQLNYKIKVVYYGAENSTGTRGGDAGKGGIGGFGGFGGMALFSTIGSNSVNITMKGHNGRVGENGAAGRAGLGGLFGDVAVRGRLLIDGRKEEMLSTRYDTFMPSNKRGPSGSVSQLLVQNERINSADSIFKTIESKFAYSHFLSSVSDNFRNSFLTERKFIQNSEFKLN